MSRTAPRQALLALVLTAVPAACAPATTGGRGTSNAAIVTAEDIAQYPNDPIERILERKVPGVQLTRTESGAIVLRIRGATTFGGRDAPPLYVVDEVPVASGPEGTMPAIAPHDIAMIRVLRGPDAAIYGVDGAHGVIVITTRKGGTR